MAAPIRAVNCARASCAIENPQNLATQLESALKARNMDGALALFDSRTLPGELKFFYMTIRMR